MSPKVENLTLSPQALAIIEGYLHLKIGGAVCVTPYFNNKTARRRATLRVYVGKGSPEDIAEEAQTILFKQHIDPSLLSDEALKKIMTDQNIGIDCSGFAYHVLDAESDATGNGPLDSRISFVNCTGLFGRMICSINPVNNCDVATLADEANSQTVTISEIKPGDMITMISNLEGKERNHILIVHAVEYLEGTPNQIHYSHSVAYPQDGVYGTGIKQGVIQVTNPTQNIMEQLWIEGGNEGSSNPIFIRATNSKTELRRLKQP